MEPGRDGREELISVGVAVGAVVPQWSPAVGREESQLGTKEIPPYRPQWSPAVMAGRSAFVGLLGLPVFLPQWSPTVMAGRSRRDRRYGAGRSRHERRVQFIDLVVSLDIHSLVYATQPVRARTQERARSLLLTRAVADLKVRGAETLVIESRQKRGDDRDRQTLLDARRLGIASPTLRYSFELPKEEPLLWVPDAAAGASTSHLCNETTAYVSRFGDCLAITEILDA